VLSRVMGVEVTREGIGCVCYNDTCYGTVQGGNVNFRGGRKYYHFQVAEILVLIMTFIQLLFGA